MLKHCLNGMSLYFYVLIFARLNRQLNMDFPETFKFPMLLKYNFQYNYIKGSPTVAKYLTLFLKSYLKSLDDRNHQIFEILDQENWYGSQLASQQNLVNFNFQSCSGYQSLLWKLVTISVFTNSYAYGGTKYMKAPLLIILYLF